MINGKKVLAYIPARSGSKSIKDKNIFDLCGKPLIAYSIETAKKSKYVDRVIISTDSPQYAEISRQYGAEAPFLRPAELATDLAKEMDTTQHLISWIEDNTKDQFQIIVRLQATSPLRAVEDIDKALELMDLKDADSIISVNECPVTPLWMNILPPDKSMANFINKDIMTKNRQELPTYYQLNGSIFAARWDFIKKKKSWYGENSYAVIIPKERALDIDVSLDLELVALLLMKNKH